MKEEQIYGTVFKKIREERGYTQKKAAGDTVTPQFLRQFEQGRSRITIQNFEGILENIGIDKETFDSVKNQLYPTNFHKLQIQIAELAYKREYQKMLSLLNKPLDNPGVPEHYVIANRVVNKFGIANIVGDSFLTEQDYQELEYIKNYLSELESWNKIEINIFTSILSHFSVEFLDYRLDHLLKKLRKETDIHTTRTADYYLACFRTAVRHYSTQGHFEKAEKLAADILGLINEFSSLSVKMSEIINISMERSLNFLRYDNPEGLELAKNIFQTLEFMEKISPNPLLIRMREDFFSTVTAINKTGKPIDF